MLAHALVATLAPTEAAFEAAKVLKEHVAGEKAAETDLKVATLLNLCLKACLGSLVFILGCELIQKLGTSVFRDFLTVEDF